MSNFLAALLGTLSGFCVVYSILLVHVYFRRRRVQARVQKLVDQLTRPIPREPIVNTIPPKPGSN